MSNFHFLATEWPEVLEPAAKAESLAYSDPRSACFYSRRALEMAMAWLYKHDAALTGSQDHRITGRPKAVSGMTQKIKCSCDCNQLILRALWFARARS
jgi:hypothetical protein